MLNTLNLHSHTVLYVTYISIGKKFLKSQEHSLPVQSATSVILISPSVKWVRVGLGRPKISSFSSNHVWMWELDCEESWAPKNWCFRTVVLEKTLESPLYCKEIQPVHPKGNQSWMFIGRTDVEAEILILWPPDAKSWLIGKDLDAGKDRRQEEKGMTEDEMVGWHHQLNGHEFGWTPGVGDGQGGLACCSLVQFSSVAQLGPTLCDPMNCSTPGFSVLH